MRVVVWSSNTFFVQVTFQCALATNGNRSFAIYYYHDIDMLVQNVNEQQVVIGFNKGDEQSFTTIPLLQSVSQTNIYRLDGMQV